MVKYVYMLLIIFTLAFNRLDACNDSICFRMGLEKLNSEESLCDSSLIGFFKNNKEVAFKIMMDELKTTQDSSKLFFYPALIPKVMKYSEFYSLYRQLKNYDSIRKSIVFVIATVQFYDRYSNHKNIDSFPFEAVVDLLSALDYKLFYYGKYTLVAKTVNISSTADWLLNRFNILNEESIVNIVKMESKDIEVKDIKEYNCAERIILFEKWQNQNKNRIIWDAKSCKMRVIVDPVVFSRDEILSIEEIKQKIDDYCIKYFAKEFEEYKILRNKDLNVDQVLIKNQIDSNMLNTNFEKDRYNTIISLIDKLISTQDTTLMFNFAVTVSPKITFDTLMTLIEVSNLNRGQKDFIEITSFMFGMMNPTLFMKSNIPNCYLNTLVRLIDNDSLDVSKYIQIREIDKISDWASGVFQSQLMSFSESEKLIDKDFQYKYPSKAHKILLYQSILNQVFFNAKWNLLKFGFDKQY